MHSLGRLGITQGVVKRALSSGDNSCRIGGQLTALKPADEIGNFREVLCIADRLLAALAYQRL